MFYNINNLKIYIYIKIHKNLHEVFKNKIIFNLIIKALIFCILFKYKFIELVTKSF